MTQFRAAMEKSPINISGLLFLPFIKKNKCIYSLILVQIKYFSSEIMFLSEIYLITFKKLTRLESYMKK